MAGVREDSRRVALREPAPGRRSLGVLILMLLAVFAAIAFMWNLSRRHARHAPAPMATSETAIPPAAPEPVQAPAAEPMKAAAAAPVTEQPAISARKQSEIARVISEGRPALTACYQRALVRDESLDYAGLAVRLSIAASGRVDKVNISGPSKFRALDPCLQKAASQWTFPTAPAAYEAEFPLVLQATQ
jgi:outer membrane biosynthesis protein TonB